MNKKKLSLIIITIVIICSSFFIIMANKKEDKYSSTYYNLGTINEITLYNINKNEGDRILKNCESILTDIDNKMSCQISTSEISKINENAGIDYVQVSDDTYYVIKESINFSKMSNDTFDITIGPIIDLWAIGTDNAKVPIKDEIIDKLSLVNYKNILFNDDNKSIKLAKKNMKIDLGGIAKGYVTELVGNYLEDHNINNYIINAGGNVKVGKAYNKEYYIVGITNPDNTSNIFTKVNINNLSVVTSGNYQRYCDIDNIRYSHIINPITKKPSNYMKSVTVITKSSLLADIYSTYLYLLPVDKGLEVVNNNNDIEAIWYIDKDNIVRSDNFNYE